MTKLTAFTQNDSKNHIDLNGNIAIQKMNAIYSKYSNEFVCLLVGFFFNWEKGQGTIISFGIKFLIHPLNEKYEYANVFIFEIQIHSES